MPLPSILKQVLSPGSVGFLAAALVIWIVCHHVWPRRRVAGLLWVALVAAIYLALGLPLVARELGDGLVKPETSAPLAIPKVDGIVVLDGDNRVGRVGQAQRVAAEQPGVPVHVLGAAWVVRALTRRGIDRARIVQDDRPATTRAQMLWIEEWVHAHPSTRLAVVASRLQMPRVSALAKTAGLSLVLVPAPADIEPPRDGMSLFVPTYAALRLSRDALYEHAALVYYSWRGWIAAE